MPTPVGVAPDVRFCRVGQRARAWRVTVEATVRSTCVDADERAWVDGLRRGDPAAFDAVFAAYRRRLYAYLVRMTRRRDLADDLLQEVFLRLAQHATRLAEETRLASWLFTVAHRLVVSWARAQAVRDQLAGDLPQRPIAQERSPLEAVADSQTQLALERAFAGLAPSYREVALLVGVEGLQPTEVAEILGLRPDTVRQRLTRARSQLAEALGDHAPPSWRTP
jgi:RNA polymerase sigma-70 factor (ECF subfamily)